MYKITLTRNAAKDLRKAPKQMQTRIDAALQKLAADPDRQDIDAKRLQGVAAFRLRVGDWRVIYVREDVIRIIEVQRIAPRGDVYR